MTRSLVCLLLLALSSISLNAQRRSSQQQPLAPARQTQISRPETVRVTVRDTITVEKSDSVTDWLVVGVAVAALLVAFVQAWYFKVQLEMMNRDLLSTHRPKLVIRNVTMKRRIQTVETWDAERGAAVRETTSEFYQVFYRIVNIGQGEATIRSARTTRFFRNPVPPYEPMGGTEYESDLVSGNKLTIKAGGFETICVNSVNFQTMYLTQYDGKFIAGVVEYVDSAGDVRTTGYLRRLNGKELERVDPVDPDFEFAD